MSYLTLLLLLAALWCAKRLLAPVDALPVERNWKIFDTQPFCFYISGSLLPSHVSDAYLTSARRNRNRLMEISLSMVLHQAAADKFWDSFVDSLHDYSHTFKRVTLKTQRAEQGKVQQRCIYQLTTVAAVLPQLHSVGTRHSFLSDQEILL